MKFPARYHPLIVLLVGLGVIISFGVFCKNSEFDKARIIGMATFFILYGSALAISQLTSGFALTQQCFRVSVARSEDPFLYWTGLVCTTIPLIGIGTFMLLVAFGDSPKT